MINSTSAWPQVRALCCNCGTLRMTTANGRLYADRAQLDGAGVWDRCIVERKCATCRTKTRHAYLRDGDPNADYCEQRQRQLAS